MPAKQKTGDTMKFDELTGYHGEDIRRQRAQVAGLRM